MRQVPDLRLRRAARVDDDKLAILLMHQGEAFPPVLVAEVHDQDDEGDIERYSENSAASNCVE